MCEFYQKSVNSEPSDNKLNLLFNTLNQASRLTLLTKELAKTHLNILEINSQYYWSHCENFSKCSFLDLRIVSELAIIQAGPTVPSQIHNCNLCCIKVPKTRWNWLGEIHLATLFEHYLMNQWIFSQWILVICERFCNSWLLIIEFFLKVTPSSPCLSASLHPLAALWVRSAK